MFKSCLSLLLLASLAGCATYRSANLENPTDGAMYMRSLPTTGFGGQVTKNWDSLIVERQPEAQQDEGKKYTINAKRAGMSASRVFAAALPAGTYRLKSLYSTSCFNGECKIDLQPFTDEMPAFQVKSHQLTDMGVLTDNGKLESWKPPLSIQISKHTPPEQIRTLTPGLTELLDQPVNSWQGPLQADWQSNRLDSVFFPSETAAGHLLYGTYTGQVYEQPPHGKVRIHETGANSVLMATLVTSSGHWLAGGELATILQSDDKGASWHSIRGNLPFGLVTNLHQWHNKIIAVTRNGLLVSVYSAETDSDQWKLLHQYQMNINTGFKSDDPTSGLIGDKLLINWFPDDHVYVLNMIDGSSTSNDVSAGSLYFAIGKDGILRGASNSMLSSRYHWYQSSDLGKTWQAMADFNFWSAPTFIDAQHGIASLYNEDYQHSFLGYTDDGGKTWKKSEGPNQPVFKYAIAYSKDGKRAYGLINSRELVISEDGGKSWHKKN